MDTASDPVATERNPDGQVPDREGGHLCQRHRRPRCGGGRRLQVVTLQAQVTALTLYFLTTLGGRELVEVTEAGKKWY